MIYFIDLTKHAYQIDEAINSLRNAHQNETSPVSLEILTGFNLSPTHSKCFQKPSEIPAIIMWSQHEMIMNYLIFSYEGEPGTCDNPSPIPLVLCSNYSSALPNLFIIEFLLVFFSNCIEWMNGIHMITLTMWHCKFSNLISSRKISPLSRQLVSRI